MAWPATVNPGDTATAAQYNALVAALKVWGGNVDGGNYALTNVASITTGTGGMTIGGRLTGQGGLVLPVRTITANTTLTLNDFTVICNTGVTTVTLPASPPSGMILNIRNQTGVAITLNGNGQTVGAAVSTLLNASAMIQYDSTSGAWQAL